MITYIVLGILTIPVSFLVVGLSNNILTKISKFWPHGQYPHFPSDVYVMLLFPIVNIFIALLCIVSSSFIYIFTSLVSESIFKKFEKWFNGD